MVAESHQSPRASSRDRSCSPRATATRGRCGPQLLSGRRRQAQPRRGAEKHHARRHHAQQHRVTATFWREQLVYCVCGPARPPQQGRCPRAIGWLIGVRCVPSGRAEMPIEAAHGAAAAACATLPAASSYPRTLPRPCRAPGATLRRRKRLLQRQRDHIAAIQPLIEIAEQYILPGHHSRFGAS